MSEAVYGLLGALGGALITAGAGYWGPWRMAQATRRDAREAGARVRIEAEITRIIAMRTTTRLWRNHLAQAISTLELGLSAGHAPFDEAVTTARNAAQSALGHALHDGIWVRQTSYGTPFDDPDDGEIRVMNALNRLTELIHFDAIRAAGREGNVRPLTARQTGTLKARWTRSIPPVRNCPPRS